MTGSAADTYRRYSRPKARSAPRGRIAAVFLIIVSAVSGAEDSPPEIGITTPGEPVPGGQAPDFLLMDLEQNPVRLSELRGKPVVLNFFASWCSPCLQELPLIQEAHVKFGDGQIVIVGIGYQDSRYAIETLAEDVGLSFTIVIDGDNSVGQAYRVIGPPYTFFIDTEGVVIEVVSGAMETEALELNLAALLERD